MTLMSLDHFGVLPVSMKPVAALGHRSRISGSSPLLPNLIES